MVELKVELMVELKVGATVDWWAANLAAMRESLSVVLKAAKRVAGSASCLVELKVENSVEMMAALLATVKAALMVSATVVSMARL